MKTYRANFLANSGDHFQNSITDTNLKRITKDIRDIANGNRLNGNCCSWGVFDEENKLVAHGGTDFNGRKYRTI